jgi:hypothetical protein
LVSTRAKHLLARQGQLAQSVNKDFTTSSRRDEVAHELEASKPILGEAAGRAEKVSGQARSFLKGMSDALSGVETPPPKDDKGAAAGKPGQKPKNGTPPPKAAPAKPASPPPPPKPVHKPPPETPKAEPAAKPAPPPKPASDEFNP